MDFAKFPVDTTSIFPHVNSVSGGQLLSEYNLRCRESIATDSTVSYMIGPSYTHSMNDFMVSGTGGTEITVSAGRALVNGHQIDAQTPVTIDLAEYNMNLEPGDVPLRGALTIGLRAMYNVDGATAGSLTGSVTDGYFEAIQITILPQGEFKLPQDVPDDPSAVTAHLKLADFSFINGAIGTINQNASKIHIINGDRIGKSSADLDKRYATITGLNGQNMYVMGGNGLWCSANETLMRWDSTTTPTAITKPTRTEASFVTDYTAQKVNLVIPHKQIDGLVDEHDTPLYLPDKVISIPVADYDAGSPGIVNKSYTDKMKEAISKLDDIYRSTNGKQVWYIDVLEDIKDLPVIQDTWEIGDYVVVRQDSSAIAYAADTTQPPSTMYIIIPGNVVGLQSPTNVRPDGNLLGSIIESNNPIILNAEYMGSSEVFGIVDWDGKSGRDYFEYDTKLYSYESLSSGTLFEPNTYYGLRYTLVSEKLNDVSLTYLPPQFTNDTYYDNSTHQLILSEPSDWSTNYGNYCIKEYDILETEPDDWGDSTGYYSRGGLVTTKYYYAVISNPAERYSEPIFLTGTVPYAQEELIGGFRNVNESYTDQGYVILDEDGHLRLIDYGLLRLGLGASQLGEDFESPAGIASEEVQYNLDEYVNDRIAFPNARQVEAGSPTVINVTINLEQESESNTILIGDIDSRFGTSVYLHILGNADGNTVINIVNCEKIRIDNNIGGTPVINLYRSNLYYDQYILSYLNTVQDLSLWYEQDDENSQKLLVDGLTVSTAEMPAAGFNSLTLSGGSNDNHIRYALKSITFDSSANIVGLSIFFGSNLTIQDLPSVSASSDSAHYFYTADFALSPGVGLSYPLKRLTKQIKIAGIYTCAYTSGTDGYITTDLNFSALSPTYNGATTSGGTIAIRMDVLYIPVSASSTISNADPMTVISAMQPGTYQVYEGYIYGQSNS